MTIDISTVIASSPIGSVVTRVNGSEHVLWFEPMPAWMTEVPVGWASPGHDSNVEVYVRTNDGDVLKAVCDSSEDNPPGLLGVTGGSEADCAYQYTASATPIVSDYYLAYQGLEMINITVFGNGFLLGGYNNTAKVTVANQSCVIQHRDDSVIRCNVTSVPWGYHDVQVNIVGYGDALRMTNKT
eukprot:gene36694-biopygen19502